MIAVSCEHNQTKKFGRHRNGSQRFRCILCGKTLTEEKAKPIGEMRIPKAKAVLIIKMLLDGCSIRTIERITEINRNTIMSLLLLVGKRCERLWEARMHDIPVNELQCDELWSFIGCKEKTHKALKRDECFGDSYTFLAFERDTKLIAAYHVGKRSPISTQVFLGKLNDAVKSGFSITTDGYAPYAGLVPGMLWNKNIDYAMLIKIYGNERASQARYSPAPIIGTIRKHICGAPDMDRVCTSHVERANLSFRMETKRFARLTLCFSKSPRHHEAAVALWLTWYNFGRIHGAHKMTPAVMAGIASEKWSVERLLDELATHS